MAFTRAGPAEILRASQKDDHYVGYFQTLLSDAVLHVFGARFSARHRNLIEGFGGLIYYGVTTLSGFQTLGEEYTGIIQTDLSYKKLPHFMYRLVMTVMECFGRLWLDQMISLVERLVSHHPDILPSAKQETLKALSVLRWFLPLIDRTHKAYFYCRGGTYHLSKRLTAIHYVVSRAWLKDRESVGGFRVLGWMTAAEVLAVVACRGWEGVEAGRTTPPSPHHGGHQTEGQLCSVCLEPAHQPTLTPCGHTHCWLCLHQWVSSTAVCPSCRAPLLPSRLVPLLN